MTNELSTSSCPKCLVALESTELHGSPAARCPRCGGLWIDDAGIAAAKDHADPNVSWLELELWSEAERFDVGAHELSCPGCGARMYRVSYRGTAVAIEHCDACHGAWLQAGAFERIVDALEEEVARMPSADLLRASMREAAELVRAQKPLVEEWADVKHVLQLLKLRVLTENPGLRKALIEIQRSTPFG